MMNEKPIIAITMGDPASIGPEIAVKAMMEKNIQAICRPLIIGDASVMKHIAQKLGAYATRPTKRNGPE